MDRGDPTESGPLRKNATKAIRFARWKNQGLKRETEHGGSSTPMSFTQHQLAGHRLFDERYRGLTQMLHDAHREPGWLLPIGCARSRGVTVGSAGPCHGRGWRRNRHEQACRGRDDHGRSCGFWRYFVRGGGWPRRQPRTRRNDSRANRLNGEVWGALSAGGLAWVSSAAQGVLSRPWPAPPAERYRTSQYTPVTVGWGRDDAVVAGGRGNGFPWVPGPTPSRAARAVSRSMIAGLFGFGHCATEIRLVIPFNRSGRGCRALNTTDSTWRSWSGSGGNM